MRGTGTCRTADFSLSLSLFLRDRPRRPETLLNDVLDRCEHEFCQICDSGDASAMRSAIAEWKRFENKFYLPVLKALRYCVKIYLFVSTVSRCSLRVFPCDRTGYLFVPLFVFAFQARENIVDPRESRHRRMHPRGNNVETSSFRLCSREDHRITVARVIAVAERACLLARARESTRGSAGNRVIPANGSVHCAH